MNYVLAVLLGGASVVPLSYAINTLARDGDCRTATESGQCVERTRFQEGSAIFGGIGLALVGAAIGVAITQPIRVQVWAQSEGGGAAVEGTF